jgi:hypothetical protein
MIDHNVQIEDDSEFTVVPDEEQIVYEVATPIITRNRPGSSVPFFKEFDATRKVTL